MPGAPPKSKAKGNNRNITEFFRQFSVPKHRVPVQHEIEDEIIVAQPQSSPPKDDKHTPRSPERTPSSSSDDATDPDVTPSDVSPKRGSVNELGLDGAFDQDSLPRPVSTPIRQRVMVEVRVPSPNRQNTLLPPPAPPIPEPSAPPETAPAANISFSSISSLSSIPLSSQSSSRRIVKGGMFAVTNSDSGSEDSESDGLADMDEMIQRKRRKLTPPGTDATKTPTTEKPSRQSTRASGRTTTLRNEKSRTSSPIPPTPPATVYKHSLLKMVKQNEQRGITQAKIAEAEALMAESERRKQQQLERETTMDGQAIAAAVADDSDEGERMLQAMDRTEALQQDEHFYFFTDTTPCAPNLSFPASSLPNETWTPIMKNKQSRQQACLMGFASSLASRGSLPLPVLEWFAFQLVHEPREDLCRAYTEILIMARGPGVSNPSSISSIRTFYNIDLGRTDVSMNGERPKREATQQSNLPARLENVIRVAACYASNGNVQTANQALMDLILANIDDNVKANAILQHIIQTAICSLLDRLGSSDVDAMFSGCLEKLRCLGLSRTLECSLISALPATTPRSHDFRRYLALHHILAIPKAKSLSSGGWQNMVLTGLKTAPEFRVNDSTDYSYLLALTNLLDIAIDVGFNPFVGTTALNTGTAESLGQYTRPVQMSPEEKAFNAEVDVLMAQIQVMISRIKDAGATHLRRTEAKTALEGLRGRLQFGVRTRPKLQKGIFNSSTGDQVNLMAAWAKGKSNGGLGAILDQRTASGNMNS